MPFDCCVIVECHVDSTRLYTSRCCPCLVLERYSLFSFCQFNVGADHVRAVEWVRLQMCSVARLFVDGPLQNQESHNSRPEGVPPMVLRFPIGHYICRQVSRVLCERCVFAFAVPLMPASLVRLREDDHKVKLPMLRSTIPTEFFCISWQCFYVGPDHISAG